MKINCMRLWELLTDSMFYKLQKTNDQQALKRKLADEDEQERKEREREEELRMEQVEHLFIHLFFSVAITGPPLFFLAYHFREEYSIPIILASYPARK